MFGASHLAYAGQAGLKPFEEDVFNNPSGKPGGNGGGGNGGNGNPGARPRITITGVPKRCVSRSFRARIRTRSNQLRNVQVLLDRRRIAMRNSRNFTVAVRTTRLRRSGHLLTVRARDATRRSGRKTVKFRVCRDDDT
jgi:hypothetical protein